MEKNKKDYSMTREEVLKNTTPSERSEVAAKYDAQVEADSIVNQINTMSFDEEEKTRAKQDVNMEDVCDYVEDCGVEKGYVYDRLFSGVLPDRIRTSINTIMNKKCDIELVNKRLVEIAKDRLTYLRKRYGVEVAA